MHLTYNVTSAYNHLLSSANNNLAADHTTEIWNKEVPLKVSLFVGVCCVIDY